MRQQSCSDGSVGRCGSGERGVEDGGAHIIMDAHLEHHPIVHEPRLTRPVFCAGCRTHVLSRNRKTGAQKLTVLFSGVFYFIFLVTATAVYMYTSNVISMLKLHDLIKTSSLQRVLLHYFQVDLSPKTQAQLYGGWDRRAQTCTAYSVLRVLACSCRFSTVIDRW